MRKREAIHLANCAPNDAKHFNCDIEELLNRSWILPCFSYNAALRIEYPHKQIRTFSSIRTPGIVDTIESIVLNRAYCATQHKCIRRESIECANGKAACAQRRSIFLENLPANSINPGSWDIRTDGHGGDGRKLIPQVFCLILR